LESDVTAPVPSIAGSIATLRGRCKTFLHAWQPADFMRQWARAPIQTGAVASSGPRLARQMTLGLGPADGPIIELGPGTGVFSQAILDLGIAPASLALVEINRYFLDRLRRRFPAVAVHEANARQLGHLLPFGPHGAGMIICGLPLRNFSLRAVYEILKAGFANLRPDGRFVLFTYASTCPIHDDVLDRLGLVATRRSIVWRNLPPAAVFVITRRSQ
jgi:phosphatidylethanolamine/phosphatidyl-N-methylethanolamine N-methyltransferase